MKIPPLLPGWLLTVTVIVFFAAMCVTLQGCSTTENAFDYRWTKTRPASVKPWLYVVALDVDAACRMHGARSAQGDRINGCAQWREFNCLIILPEGAPDWIRRHEERHCEGWSH